MSQTTKILLIHSTAERICFEYIQAEVDAVSDLAEKLVVRWHREYDGKSELDEARWWLNAIADAMEDESEVAWSHLQKSADWLRSQATEGDEK